MSDTIKFNTDFDRLMYELVFRNPKLYMGKTNDVLPKNNMTAYMIPGVIGPIVGNEKRQANMQVVFDSVGEDKDQAYNDLLQLQEEILQNTEYYDKRGFEFSLENLEGIQDLTYLEGAKNVYRYNFTIEVFYFRSTKPIL